MDAHTNILQAEPWRRIVKRLESLEVLCTCAPLFQTDSTAARRTTGTSTVCSTCILDCALTALGSTIPSISCITAIIRHTGCVYHSHVKYRASMTPGRLAHTALTPTIAFLRSALRDLSTYAAAPLIGRRALRLLVGAKARTVIGSWGSMRKAS